MTTLVYEIGGRVVTIEHNGKKYSVSSCDDVKKADGEGSSTAIAVPHLPLFLTERDVYVIESLNSEQETANPPAGSELYTEAIGPLLDTLNVKYTHYLTKTASSMAEFGGQLDPHGKYLLIVFSGDTSISELLNGLPYTEDGNSVLDVCIVPVPSGSANAFAANAGLKDPMDSISALVTGKQRPLPLYEATFSPHARRLDDIQQVVGEPLTASKFFVIGSWGLHATLVAESDSPKLRKLGNARFKVAAAKILAENPEFTGTISTRKDGATKDSYLEVGQPLSYFILSAVKELDPGFEISPNSKIEEQGLNLLYFRHVDGMTTMKIMEKAYQGGSHLSDPHVRYLDINPDTKVVLKLDDAVTNDRFSKICLDGTSILIQGKDRTVTFGSLSVSNLTFAA